MMINPFEQKDKAFIWDMLVKRDILAFTNQDWSMVDDDFMNSEFVGMNAGFKENPDEWRLDFPSLDSYKKEWLRQANKFRDTEWEGDTAGNIYQCTFLEQIDIRGEWAIAHKKFQGHLTKKNGEKVPMNWQTLYRCRRIGEYWKIAGFIGYLPYKNDQNYKNIQLPEDANQHKTGGPYSPVLMIRPGTLVVISGQAAIDMEGDTVGTTIEEQTAYTLDNCLRQLQSAGCDFNNVFKVNVFLKNIEDWNRFNTVYKTYFNQPFPVRTAVQVGLLGTLLVEMELWANK